MIRKFVLTLLCILSINLHAALPKYLVIAGGGARGIVLLGAFEVLLDDPDFCASTEHLIGSSVGAMTAAALACGATAEHMQYLQSIRFDKIIGSQLLLNSGKSMLLFIKEQVKHAIQSQLMEQPIDDALLETLSEFDQVLYTSLLDNLSPYLSIEKTNITFEMLDLLHRLDPIRFKALSITATCTNVDAKHALFILNVDTAPRLDIAIACRASISLPLFFSPVEIHPSYFNLSHLPEKYSKQNLQFIDGGWLNNVPVRSLEKLLAIDPNEVRLNTWVFVYEEALKEHELSIFHPNRPLPSYSTFATFFMDGFLPFFGGFPHLPSATQIGYKDLVYLKMHYPHILSFPVDLSVVDFEKSYQYRDYYTEIGRQMAREYLMDALQPIEE